MMDNRALAEKIFVEVFADTQYVAKNPEEQAYCDVMTKMIQFIYGQRIEAILNAHRDTDTSLCVGEMR